MGLQYVKAAREGLLRGDERVRSAKEAMWRKKCILVVVITAWTSCPQLTLSGMLDGGRPIPGPPPGTSDVAEPLPHGTDFEISLLPNLGGLRCGAVGPLVPLFIFAVLSLSGKLSTYRRRGRFS